MEEAFDRFEEPTYSEDVALEERGSLIEKTRRAGEVVRKNIGVFALAAVLLIAVFFGYDFFIGSVKDIVIVVKNPEGNQISNSKLKVFDQSGNQIASMQGAASYATRLRVGFYTVEARAPNHKRVRKTLRVTSSGETFQVVLEKDIDVEIVDFKERFPTQLVEGQTRVIEFTLQNKENTPQEVEVVFEGELKKWNVSSKKVAVASNGVQTVLVEVRVPQLGLKTTGKEFKAIARIKYTLSAQEKEFKVLPNPNIEVQLSGFGQKARAGQTITNALVTVKNRSGFSVHGLTVNIEITVAEENNPTMVREWFKFQERANAPNPWSIEIDTLGGKEVAKKSVRIDVPLTAKEETITGKVVVSSELLAKAIEKTFNLVVEKAKFGLELRAPSTVRVQWLGSEYEKVAEEITVKNVGELPLKNIVLSVENYAECTTDWLELKEPLIDSLERERDVTIEVSAPIGRRCNETPMLCKIKYRFDNPLGTQPDFIAGEMEGYITISPRIDEEC